MPKPQTVKITPTKNLKIPFDTSDEKPNTFLEELAVAGNTAELQHELGAILEVDEATAEKEKNLLEQVVQERKKGNLQTQNTAFAAAAFLREYGAQLALDAAQARAAITNKLMEIANCGDAKYELKALELLGKHSDIGLFTDRSEITINYKNPEDLESAIKERVKRLLNADVIDITPLNANLDEELGVVELKDEDSQTSD
jgi:exopolyphosphatase/pppGpp-phosphohydrolase